MYNETSINVLNLKARTYNCLIGENIYSIEQLEKKDSNFLLKIPNLGKTSLAEIETALKKYNSEKNETLFKTTLADIQKTVEEGVYRSINSYLLRINLDEGLKNMVDTSLKDMKKEIQNSLFANINEIRTIVLEQSRILEGMQSMQAPNSIINRISEKVPGFNTMIYELYKTLEKE